jgi:hypothetical protein
MGPRTTRFHETRTPTPMALLPPKPSPESNGARGTGVFFLTDVAAGRGRNPRRTSPSHGDRRFVCRASQDAAGLVCRTHEPPPRSGEQRLATPPSPRRVSNARGEVSDRIFLSDGRTRPSRWPLPPCGCCLWVLPPPRAGDYTAGRSRAPSLAASWSCA